MLQGNAARNFSKYRICANKASTTVFPIACTYVFKTSAHHCADELLFYLGDWQYRCASTGWHSDFQSLQFRDVSADARQNKKQSCLTVLSLRLQAFCVCPSVTQKCGLLQDSLINRSWSRTASSVGHFISWNSRCSVCFFINETPHRHNSPHVHHYCINQLLSKA